MATQQRRGSKKLIFLTDFWRLVQSHKTLSLVAPSVILLALLIGLYNFAQYQQKFSKNDFERLASMAETVLHDSSRKPVEIKKECSYERPGEFESLHLYCRLAMVSYLNFENELHALAVALSFKQNVERIFGRQYLAFSSFYERPTNGYGASVVSLEMPFPKRQCNFYIDSNQNAKRVLTFPARQEDSLIALSFECSAESRSEYYPVTYRQG